MSLRETLTGTPLWVFIVLAVLVALGYSQSRARKTSGIRVLLLPAALLIFSAASTAATFGPSPSSLAVWAAGYATGLLAGRYILPVSGATYTKEDGHFAVPGSWLPMVLILAIFLAKYTVAVLQLTKSQLLIEVWFRAAAATTFGLVTGLFGGRAWSVLTKRAASDA